MSESEKAVFLDRDGTLNEDPGYLSQPEQMRLLPGVGEALAKLSEEGFLLVVVSNQSGVARGLISKKDLPLIHARLNEHLKPSGVFIDHFELCFHHPDDGCSCRKPKPRMILDAATQLKIDLSRSFMVGDRMKDIDAGRSVGCKGVALVRTGHGLEEEKNASDQNRPDFIGDTLTEVVHWILNSKT